MPSKPSIKDLSQKDLEALFAALGEPAYRSRQLMSWLYTKGADSFDLMSDMRKNIKAALAEKFDIDNPHVAENHESEDGTRKFALELKDGLKIETVIIPDDKRVTLCVSTQAGCRRGCKLCATASMGFQRNLTQGEITNQIIAANRMLKGAGLRVTNIVFMGMGEPMDNLDNVLAALTVIVSDHGFVMSPGRVTVSTVGVLEGIRRLSLEGGGVLLAISLHAADDETRKKLIPQAHEVTIRELIEAARDYAFGHRDKVMFEYVLIKGLNCSKADGEKLNRLLSGLPAKINLIRYNDAVNPEFSPPDDAEIEVFKQELFKGPTIVTMRKSRGRDIKAACGQLCVT